MKQDLFIGRSGFSRQRQKGGFLIYLGILFMLGMSDMHIFGKSPWILMALIPLYWFAIAAYITYQREGELNERVLFSAIPMLIPFMFVGSAILGYNPGKLWPVWIIGQGVVLLFSGRRR